MDPEIIGRRVFVYWNLHRKCWSLRSLEGPDKGRVIGHAQAVFLKRCKFKVSQAGRARVLREGRKNVHAGVEGTVAAEGLNGAFWNSYIAHDFGSDRLVSYNPRTTDRFYDVNRPWQGIYDSVACYMGPLMNNGQWTEKSYVRALGVFINYAY